MINNETQLEQSAGVLHGLKTVFLCLWTSACLAEKTAAPKLDCNVGFSQNRKGLSCLNRHRYGHYRGDWHIPYRSSSVLFQHFGDH